MKEITEKLKEICLIKNLECDDPIQILFTFIINDHNSLNESNQQEILDRFL